MDNVKDDTYYSDKIKNDLIFIINHMSGVDIGRFNEDEVLQDSMMFRLVQISENAKKLSDTYKSEYGSIPWTDIYGLRNRIVHEYGNVDLQIIYDTLVYDIPDVFGKMKRIK